ncbi:hypothetical protein [Alteromonas sp. S167]|uniref:hypothetical protein n=1 Tax=Alteromonas sp. S167 TaxID=3117402 RepID=UPI002FE0BBE5
MLSRFSFNHYILLSEKWLTKIALLWCGFSVLLGFVVQVEIALIIAAPLMTLCMFFAGMVLSSTLIGFQKINPFAKSNPNFIKFAILFFWSFGIIAALYFLSSGIFQVDEKNSTRYFLVVASVFPLGPTLGAAKEWNKD